jgi:hypothetical protein
MVMALSNGINIKGCGSASRDIPLAYDPGNKKTPFKGSGVNCPRIELRPRWQEAAEEVAPPQIA